MQNPKLQKIVQEAVQQARAEGLDETDAKFMATGAVVREARNQGVIGEVLSPEMNAAAKALVEQELKNGGKKGQ